MAIKTVSQLEAFENGQSGKSGTSNYGTAGVGRNLAFFQDGYLTDADKSCSNASGGSSHSQIVGGNAYSAGLTNSKFDSLKVADNTTYWSSLFEISQPQQKSSINAPKNEPVFRSYSIQYEDILKNVLWDVKSYLNFRNRLNDYNLCSIVEGDQYFRGKKYIVGGLSVSDALSSKNLSAANLTAANLTAANLTADNLTATNLTADNLTAVDSLYVHCNISTDELNRGFDGYAFGLMDRDADNKLDVTNKTTVGTCDENYIGDPVMFLDGRPVKLTAVNYAMSAYNLVDSEKKTLWDVGKGARITSLSDVTADISVPYYQAVYFKDGKPQPTNIIDYALSADLAHHALWSDLGEKYLADKPYEPGTLVKFGGEKEITIADDEVNAIVSTKAFELNCGLEGGTTIALCGRVPTKVKGKIKKFEKIMLSDVPGVACVWDGKSRVIGRALESNGSEEVKLVECVTKFEL